MTSTGDTLMDAEDDAILRLRLIPYNKRLIDARKASGFTQKDMHLMTGISIPHIGDIETLKRRATGFEKGEIASVLSNTVEYLFPEELEVSIEAGAFSERKRLLTGGQVEALLPGHIDAETEKLENTYLLPEAVKDTLSEILTPRERKVIEMRFGFIDGRNRTLEEVGEVFNVTRSRIRDIEAQALRKIRLSQHLKKLGAFVELQVGSPVQTKREMEIAAEKRAKYLEERRF